MTGGDEEPANRLRMVFELARADNPRLFDELSRFPQGSRRVNRLRLLAYDGLLAQAGVLGRGAGLPGMPIPVESAAVPAQVTNQLFEPGFKE